MIKSPTHWLIIASTKWNDIFLNKTSPEDIALNLELSVF
jgi:hypothetical protein